MTITSLNIQDGTFKERRCRIRKRHVIFVVATFVVLAIVAIYLLTNFSTKTDVNPNILNPPNPESPLGPSISALRKFQKGAVCSDAAVCSEIGKDILERNGSAVDATIATLFCNGLVTMQSMGLGGGFVMTVYTREDKKAVTLNAREAAPLKSTPNMFATDPDKSKFGPLAIAVPGELKGYRAAHEKFGKLEWKELVLPTIKLCKNGFNISQHQFNSLKFKNVIKNDTILKHLFVLPDGNFKPLGSLIKHEIYCNTLERIAENGDDLYNGTLADILVKDIQHMGGILTKEDLLNYEATWEDAVNVQLKENQLHSVSVPGSGHLLAFILNVLQGYNFTKESINGINNTVLTYHRIIETFKYAFAQRTHLGDPNYNNITAVLQNLLSNDFAAKIRQEINDTSTSQDPVHYGALSMNKDDHGTAHVSVLAPNGDAVSVTSTVNLYFGAGLTSNRTGIILNSGMDDFSSPGIKNYFGIPFSAENDIKPGKRPLSSMSPAIITDKNGDVRMVIGAAGGTKILSAIALVIIRSLWFEQALKVAIDAPRFHHQIYPMQVSYEFGTIQPVVTGLEALGHNTTRFKDVGSVICALARQDGLIYANADYRKGGDVFGLD